MAGRLTQHGVFWAAIPTRRRAGTCIPRDISQHWVVRGKTGFCTPYSCPHCREQWNDGRSKPNIVRPRGLGKFWWTHKAKGLMKQISRSGLTATDHVTAFPWYKRPPAPFRLLLSAFVHHSVSPGHCDLIAVLEATLPQCHICLAF